MSIPNFYSVERKGYLTISDLFADVMKDMIDHGFTLISSSNDYPLSVWTANILSSVGGFKTGDKLYVTDGTRPTVSGIQRNPPYFEVQTVATVGNVANAVLKLSELRSDYDYPVWVETPDLGNISLKTQANITTYLDSNVFISMSKKTAFTSNVVDSGSSAISSARGSPEIYNFTLEAGGAVDPWNGETHPTDLPERNIEDYERQSWRVHFTIRGEQTVLGYVATGLQIYLDDVQGRVLISKVSDDSGDVIDIAGALGSAQVGGVYSDTDLNQCFYNRKIRVSTNARSFPLSYLLTITDRGFFLGIYEGSWSTTRAAQSSSSNYFNWVLVQRPVDRNFGTTLISGKAPVFNVNSVNYRYYKNIVRESDVLHPTNGPLPIPGIGGIVVANPVANQPSSWFATATLLPDTGETPVFTGNIGVGYSIYDNIGKFIGQVKKVDSATKITFKEKPVVTQTTVNTWAYTTADGLAYRVLADRHSPDNHMIFNSAKQISLTEDKTYLMSFPHNLTTPRFRYTEELDMIGTTSADVVMSGQEIQFTTYGETGPRTYRALPPSGELNTGLRLAVIWAPTGPTWNSPAEGSLGEIRVNDVVNVTLSASPVPQVAGEDPWQTPTFELVKGTLPSGLELSYVEEEAAWKISGIVLPAEFTEAAVIKFTISAENVEDSGYSYRDFWFTYVPE